MKYRDLVETKVRALSAIEQDFSNRETSYGSTECDDWLRQKVRKGKGLGEMTNWHVLLIEVERLVRPREKGRM